MFLQVEESWELPQESQTINLSSSFFSHSQKKQHFLAKAFPQDEEG